MTRHEKGTRNSTGTRKKTRDGVSNTRKWRRDLDRECQTMSWLDCVVEREGAKTVVAELKCKVWTEFVDRIRGRKNFSEKWIAGADSVRISNVRDHARNDQHTHAMALLKKQRSQAAGLGPSSYAPIDHKAFLLLKRFSYV